MTTEILQVSNARLGHSDRGEGQAALEAAITRAIDTDVDAFVLCGNLFDGNDLSPETVEVAKNLLKRLGRNNIPVFGIRGPLDRKSDGFDLLVEDGLVVPLTTNAHIVDEVVLYGIDHKDGDVLRNAEFELDDLYGYYDILCVHQHFHPPLDQPGYDIKPYSLIGNIDGWIDSVVSGGETTKHWSHNGSQLVYGGALNPLVSSSGEATCTLLTVADDELTRDVLTFDVAEYPDTDSMPVAGVGSDESRSEPQTSLYPASVLLVDLMERRDVDNIESMGTDELVDLFLLVSKVAEEAESLRSVIETVLSDRELSQDELPGTFGAVRHSVSEQKMLKPDEVVLERLSEEGVAPTTAVSADAEKVSRVVDSEGIPDEEVYDMYDRVDVGVEHLDVGEIRERVEKLREMCESEE